MDAILFQVWPIVLAALLGIIWIVREMARTQTEVRVLRGQVKLLLDFQNGKLK